MQSVQAMHEYMFCHLMILVAVTSHAICVWNVSEVQINIQIYAFNSDVNDENTFNLLKIILHLYHLVEQMQSLCWDYVNICNAFSIFFFCCFHWLLWYYITAMLSLVEIITARTDCLRLNCIFVFSWIKLFRSVTFLMMRKWEMMWLTLIRWTCISSHACLIFCI